MEPVSTSGLEEVLACCQSIRIGRDGMGAEDGRELTRQQNSERRSNSSQEQGKILNPVPLPLLFLQQTI